ncbi:MAG: hypothetical protein QXR57_06285 [Metallosphaera sp.]|uniref:Uncharacterized protein n=1 Tax=Metallosphaera cuprina (strain Ar-4) TaxID=1006006 RepID=F4G159_METCR|nr:hypothetical protein [Metallosphaera cuprina]AEB94749.1 conserved hypothetical protein [Metallosphaera cuprina Ar-4]
MLDELLKIANELNKGNLTKAVQMILDVSKDEDDEKILRISSELERTLRELSNDLAYDEYDEKELIEIERAMNELRKRKLRILSILALRKLSKDNLIIENIIQKDFITQKPQTYM